jgi:hypothetical protein
MTQCASERIAASKLEENQIGWRLSRNADSIASNTVKHQA